MIKDFQKLRKGIIYKATSPSGRVYVGQTVLDFNRRKKLHVSRALRKNSKTYNTKFSRAIRKYGNAIKWEIICEVEESRLNLKERELIRLYNSYSGGYNSTFGGESTKGIKLSKATREKISCAMKGKNNPFYGKKHSAEFKQRLSKERRGKNNPFYGKTGDKHHLAKLTWDQVNYIRDTYLNEAITHRELAERYNISRSGMSAILCNNTWKSDDYQRRLNDKKKKI